jgi:hypothetical protein
MGAAMAFECTFKKVETCTNLGQLEIDATVMGRLAPLGLPDPANKSAAIDSK